MRVLVAYDGTIKAKEALRYGIRKAKEEKGGRLVALYVHPSTMLAGYDSVPYARAMAMAEADRHIEDAKSIVRNEAGGIWARVETEEGIPDDETIAYASEWSADMILCPPHMRSVITKYKKLLGKEGRQAREGEVIDNEADPRMSVLYAV